MAAAPEAPPADLEIHGVSKAFGRYLALKGVSLAAADREFLALLGPSGSGKTTLLRILAGLEQPDAGQVSFRGQDLLALPARRRRIGMVFQHYALFSHMSVTENIAFGLKIRPRGERPAAGEIRRRVGELLELVQLPGLETRYPAQLSGGQRQRVALARALAIEPRMLLLDEPFGALDAQVRRELRRWLRDLHDRASVTTVFVTHDQQEALDLADRVAVLRDGVLVQTGPPQALYDQPSDPFVYEFLGPACRLDGFVQDGSLRVGDWVSAAAAGTAGGAVDVFFRPDEVDFAPADGTGLAAKVLAVSARGPDLRVDCRIEGQAFELVARDNAPPAGPARIRPRRLTLFAR
ncbi:MAG TPA: sulfate/molybdate ABC transporter ATP-binding protein [Caulobacteraceae bacterium]